MTDKKTTLGIANRKYEICYMLFNKEFKELTKTEKQEFKKFMLKCEDITI
mgnify:CR=1 FL=1|tara:strand:+ start:158 stop:307 length:150 start_codon:yes stop_codon:yes gene_type:complete